jgi:multiple sugar transport system substrate-binding protein
MEEHMRDSTTDRPDPGRRAFLAGTAVLSAAAGLEGILAARRAPAFAQGTKLHLLRWVDFIPACDVALKQDILPAASKALGAEIQLETVNGNDLQPPITAAIQSGSGPDIIMMLHNWPHLYAGGLADVTDLADWKASDQGGYYPHSEAAARVGSRWLGLPYFTGAPLIAYRKSWFAEVGASQPLKTLEEYKKIGTALKKKGKPFGQTLGHTFGDAPAWTVPVHVDVRWRRDRRQRQEGRPQLEGHAGGGGVDDRSLEAGVRRERAGLGRHQQQSGLPRR